MTNGNAPAVMSGIHFQRLANAPHAQKNGSIPSAIPSWHAGNGLLISIGIMIWMKPYVPSLKNSTYKPPLPAAAIQCLATKPNPLTSKTR
jgi:hypothetical protein